MVSVFKVQRFRVQRFKDCFFDRIELAAD